MDRLFPSIRKGADAVAAGMLAANFATFLFQILARYVLHLSVGWTIEVTLTMWLWLVLFSCAFVLREKDHVKFDVVFHMVSPTTKKVFALLSAASIVVALIAAMPDTWDYVTFYKIKRSATLRIPLIYVFWVYLLFAVVIVLRYAWRIYDILNGRDLAEDERDILSD